jgi:septal ring factor EnvC (AmiA/AmiB activator)
MVLRSPPAAADQIGQLRARATAISHKLIQDQLEIDAYQQQYSVASDKVAADAQALIGIGAQIDQDEGQLTTDTRVVRQLALSSYMNGGELAGSEGLLFAADAEALQSANEYVAVVTGDIETALDRLRAAQITLQANEATLRQHQAQDRSDQAQRAVSLSGATMAESEMAAEESLVTGQLASAVGAQASSQDAAAAAAVADARRDATHESTSKAPTGAGASDIVADPALNSYLQCVVQAESRGDYGAVSPNGMYMGAFQFSQPTWNTAALDAGLPDLVGMAPNHASKAEQDTLAVALYSLDGDQPWLGDRCA